ncbi:MAG: hypothetical protein PHW40_06105 [Candidatus Izemoplasmatales bacterium]|nr:hypothetical protein [Candidatus Izemoplasmatales bacterium]
MKRLVGLWLLGLWIGLSTPLVVQSDEIDHVFDFDHVTDVSVANPLTEPVTIIEGMNIASGDYTYDRDTDMITFHQAYLVHLVPGIHAWNVWGLDHYETLTIEIIDRHQAYRIINGGFETGDLLGFTALDIFKGERTLQAFTDRDVQGVSDGNLVQAVGAYYLGLDPEISPSLQKERMGILRSSAFVLGGSGFIAFRLGGGLPSLLTYLSVRLVENDREVARFIPFIDPLSTQTPELRLYQADLSAYIGQRLLLEFCDYGGRAHDFLIIDDIETYHPEVPLEGILLEDKKPTFNAPYPPNQVQNGSFAQGLDHWMEVLETTAFHVVDGQLRSNDGGDSAIGMIRSNLFRLDGAGVISMKLGAAAGERFDKDTFVSIRHYPSHREIYRFANDRHDGIEMKTYYVDLSDYIGETFYFEIIDNAGGSYDTIFVDDILTYYAARPFFDYSVLAKDLLQWRDGS